MIGDMQPTDRPKPWGKAPTHPKNVKLIILSPDRTAKVTETTTAAPDPRELQLLMQMLSEQYQGKQNARILTGSAFGKLVTVGLSVAVVAMALKTGPLPAGLALLLGLLLERVLARIWPAKKSPEN